MTTLKLMMEEKYQEALKRREALRVDVNDWNKKASQQFWEGRISVLKEIKEYLDVTPSEEEE